MNPPRRSQHQASEFTLTRAQIEALFNAAGSLRDRCLLELLYWGALRRSEAAELDRRRVELTATGARLRIFGKGDKERVIPLPASVAADLRLLGQELPPIPGRPDRPAPMFHSHKGGVYMSPRQINRIVATTAKRAGVKHPRPGRSGVNPHLLRHSFIRHFLDGGGDLRAVSWLAGHSSVAITADIYGTPSQDFIEKEYRRVMEKGSTHG